MKANPNILISRTDSIGDVVLTLPMAGLIKKQFPESKIIFLGRTYTRDVVALSEHVDEFLNYDELKLLKPEEQIAKLKELEADCILHVFPRKEIAMLAEQAGIPLRVGTLSRLYHLYTCNRKVYLPRKNSNLHEAQLNLKLLGVLGIQPVPQLNEIWKYYGFTKLPELRSKLKELIDPTRVNLILHPKSKGSAREWGLENYQSLVNLLPKNKFKIFVSGTKEEGDLLQDWLSKNKEITNLCGQLKLKEFIAFIAASDALIAASTIPLHIAAALHKNAIGLFAPMRPIHPGRWKPLGQNAKALCMESSCKDCKSNQDCHCIREIKAQQVLELIL